MPFVIVFIAFNANAQMHSGARYTAMGNGGVALQGVYSLGSNQEGIANLPNTILALQYVEHFIGTGRSEERRVGKECVSTCRSRWSPGTEKKKKIKRIKLK